MYYFKTFEKLKNILFISKEVLFPIYGYFKKVYDIVTNEKELEDNKQNNITIFKKFGKAIKLIEILYEPNNIKEKNISSFCCIGGNMNIVFNQKFQLSKEDEIKIKIKFLNKDYFNYLIYYLLLIEYKNKAIF